jgi:hypothetical protein
MRALDVVFLALAFGLSAGPAMADPASLIIGFLGVSATGVTAALIRIGVAVAMTALSQLMAARKLKDGPQGFTLRSITAGDQTGQSFILGRYATSGNLTAPEMSHGPFANDGLFRVTRDTRYLTRVIDLSDVRIDALESLIIDGVACELATGTPATLTMTDGDGDTPAIHPVYGPTVNKGDFIGTAWCKFYDGTQTEADPYLVARYDNPDKPRPWTPDMVGRGVAYAILTFLQRASPVVWQGRPNVRFVVRGIRLYDPRKDSTAGGSGSHRYGNAATHEWTDNPVVMIYNLLRGIRVPASQAGELYGGGYGAEDLPYANWAAAMNACDVMEGERKRYTAGMEVVIGGRDGGGQSPDEVIDELMKACGAQITDVGGTVYIRVGAPGLPVKFITDADILVSQPQELDPFPGAQDSFNVVHATFMAPGQLWSPREAPPRRDADAIAEDGQELAADIALPAVTISGQAQQLMKAWLKDARRFIRQSVTLPPEGLLLKPLDVVDWTSERNGYAGKQFEVGQVAVDPASLCTTLALREVNPSDYDWSIGDELAQDAPDAEITPPNQFRSIPAPQFDVTAELRVGNEQVVGVMVIRCRSESVLLDRYDVSYRRAGDDEWRVVGMSDLSTFEVSGLSDGSYDVRARARSVYGAVSPYTEKTGVQLAFFSAPPADVQNFSGNVVGGFLLLTWDAVPDLDLSHYKLRYARATTGATYQNAVDLVTKVARPGVSLTVPARTGTYFIRAVDKLGIASRTAAQFVVVTNIDQVENLNAVEVRTEEPAFAGARQSVVRLDDGGLPYLTLDTATLFDAATGDFDDAVGLFDGGGASGEVIAEGVYEFADVIDLGQRYTSRVRVDLDVLFLDYADSFDAAPGLFDSRPGEFDGDPAAFDLTSVQPQVSWTDDNPAASPVWSGWQNLSVSDISARALRFRVLLGTRSQKAAPAVTGLRVEVDMPDRVESGQDITFTGTRVVTFGRAFRVTPAIGVAVTLAAGDRFEISAKSRSGFTIKTFTGGAASTNAATFDYVVRGYGGEIA